jgi:GTPase SAR1 family protein
VKIYFIHPYSLFYSHNSTSSQHMEDLKHAKGEDGKDAAYKIAMLGESAVGKSSLTYQFTTSEYICAYDLSLGELPF